MTMTEVMEDCHHYKPLTVGWSSRTHVREDGTRVTTAVTTWCTHCQKSRPINQDWYERKFLRHGLRHADIEAFLARR